MYVNKAKVLSTMPNLQTNRRLEIEFQRVHYHTGGIM